MSTTDLTASAPTPVASTGTVPIAEELLTKVLEPYSYKGCRYLIDAESKATADSVLAYGNFRIGESAYIRSTGHFNAVELILCFNQLAYSAFAPAVANKDIPALRGWSLEDYFRLQLSSMFIRNASSRFKRPINPGKFSARLLCRDFQVIERTWRYLRVPCAIEFWDDDGGAASGEIELAALNIP
ncbi:FcoT-like thioesterase domain protein [Mycobacterium basiliense]|uniref:(2E)-enoyl-[ACP] glycyltransferase n=1 Tax=Mycobacterium basiliense TaxID=2094119 RepID=A0A3S4FJL0_9MYCO|nr:FcoT family thioesterase [Mycobacterium basiliense]VDM86670.1 FcoT-like thioesterase domain protein [Mycobacterium basiliense]